MEQCKTNSLKKKAKNVASRFALIWAYYEDANTVFFCSHGIKVQVSNDGLQTGAESSEINSLFFLNVEFQFHEDFAFILIWNMQVIITSAIFVCRDTGWPLIHARSNLLRRGNSLVGSKWNAHEKRDASDVSHRRTAMIAFYRIIASGPKHTWVIRASQHTLHSRLQLFTSQKIFHLASYSCQ